MVNMKIFNTKKKAVKSDILSRYIIGRALIALLSLCRYPDNYVFIIIFRFRTALFLFRCLELRKSIYKGGSMTATAMLKRRN